MKNQSKIKIAWKKLHPLAVLPTKAYSGDACFDLYATADLRIIGGEKALVPTGLAFAIPDGYFVKIYDRSGVASKTPLVSLAGVIDAGYRDEIRVVMTNVSDFPYEIKKGDKIAQFAVHKVEDLAFEEVEELPKSDRDKKGFGSSGT